MGGGSAQQQARIEVGAIGVADPEVDRAGGPPDHVAGGDLVPGPNRHQRQERVARAKAVGVAHRDVASTRHAAGEQHQAGRRGDQVEEQEAGAYSWPRLPGSHGRAGRRNPSTNGPSTGGL